MKLKMLWLAPLVLLSVHARASDVDSSFGGAVRLGASNYENPQANVAINLGAEFCWNTSWPVNYIGFSNSTEFQLAIFTPAPSPTDEENSVFIGHQFRYNASILYLPVSVGLSGSWGVYRGAYVSGSDNFDLFDDEDNGTGLKYQRETFFAPGVFIGATPSLLFFKAVSLGVNGFLDFNTHQIEAGGGAQIGILIP